MSKLFASGLLILSLFACNSSSPDVHTADSGMRAASDTIRASVDTAIHRIDSGIRAIADTATRKIVAVEDSLKNKLKK